MRRADHKRRRHSWDVRLRAFSIWRNLGFLPWRKPRETRSGIGKKETGDFYKGAFDSIPFLNDDAKRTFQHLLLRPGYMIRDYIRGSHDRYLAPLTSLIIFYAFFALVAALLQPVQHRNRLPIEVLPEMAQDSVAEEHELAQFSQSIAQIVWRGYLYLHLDQHPEAVKTQRQSALAALEGTLRSQGIPLFIGEFLFLWLAMSLALRRQKIGMSACAAASAYVLCQFSFFMLFAVVLTWGRSSSISVLLMLALLLWDYRQWLNLGWKESIHLTLRTGIIYGLIYGMVILLISALVLLIALIKVRT
ncbi:MAG: DUF3667 domain-containing protein [Bacteroidales bacterium]|nr:DUF3667 domain-containing protein [Bacteroidales bacterium]